MLIGSAILTLNSGVPLTMDAQWSRASKRPVTVAQGGFGPIDIVSGRGETHQFQVKFWCQLNGFEYDFELLKTQKFDLEYIEGDPTLGGVRARYGPCLFSDDNFTVNNDSGTVFISGTIIALRRK